MSTLQQQLGARIRDLRKARGLSQEQLGELSRVSYKFIGDVERGHGNPTIKWLDAVARGLGLTIRDLIVEEAPRPLAYLPISGRDYSVVREARDSLDAIISRYGKTGSTDSPPARPRRSKSRPKPKKR